MFEGVTNFPMALDHDVARRGMFRQVKKPQSATRLPRSNEERRVVSSASIDANMIAQRSLNESFSPIAIPILDQVVYLRFSQLKRFDRLDQLWRFRKMVDKRICGKRQYDFRS